MKQLYLLTFLALICVVLYLVGTKRINTPPINTLARQQGPVERIISLCKHPIPTIVLGLDASERRLVGINPGARMGLQSNILSRYFPGLQKVSYTVCTTGFVPNIEEMIKLQPDMVLTWSRFPEAIAQMQGFGFNVAGVNYDGSDQNDRDMVYLVARAIGREAKADSIMQIRDSMLSQMKAVSDPIAVQDRPKVIFLYNYETLTIGGERCYENFCINLAGGRNMGAGLGVDRSVNLEQILAWDPDVIFIGGWLNNTSPENIYQNPMLADLSAVRNRRVYKAPIWSSNESVLIWKWMAEMIQPARFKYDLRKDIAASYAWLYKINLTEADIDQVLFYSANAGSQFYPNLKSL